MKTGASLVALLFFIHSTTSVPVPRNVQVGLGSPLLFPFLSCPEYQIIPAPDIPAPKLRAPGQTLFAPPVNIVSALPDLREKGAKRCSASLLFSNVKDEDVEHVIIDVGCELGPAPGMAVKLQAYCVMQNATPYVRNNGVDSVVVGIVLIFVAVVVCVEAITKLGRIPPPL